MTVSEARKFLKMFYKIVPFVDINLKYIIASSWQASKMLCHSFNAKKCTLLLAFSYAPIFIEF